MTIPFDFATFVIAAAVFTGAYIIFGISAFGAALFTVVSAFGFSGDMVDPTRVAAQIVSGIGFIGAGTILQYRGHIRGLTTAASLWSVAAIGTAAGAGLYVVAIVGTVLILVILSILDRVEDIARRRLQLPPPNYALPSDPDAFEEFWA